MKKNFLFRAVMLMFFSLAGTSTLTVSGANPFLPLWECIPDGEPHVFEDPDSPGKFRVYLYGSHDMIKTSYCGRDQVVWSAPIDDLNNWRYVGVIFTSTKDANGNLLNPNGVGDVLFAPDVAEVVDKNGKKTYYLYPNNQGGNRNGMIAKSNRPNGPFTVCNWSKDDPRKSDGILAFDPAVLVDNDGRVYGYWGFQQSFGAELDPNTMATVKPGTEIVRNMVSSNNQEGKFRFFEASSIRKIKDKYVFIYSRWTENGEFGLPDTNYTLAYAYSNNPLGPFTYGGTIIDGRARGTDENGKIIPTATPSCNTHGSICEINGKWYVFYHRENGVDEYARQAMVAPITVKVTEGQQGKVEISEGEYTSEGFEINGLNPFERHSAGIACYYTGTQVATHNWPKTTYYGSYPTPFYGTEDKYEHPYDIRNNTNPVVNNLSGSIVGYKYFNFNSIFNKKNVSLLLNLKPEGIDGTINIMIDSPWPSKGGIKVGSISVSKNMPNKVTQLRSQLSKVNKLKGKHALFFVFSSPTTGKSICEMEDFVFE